MRIFLFFLLLAASCAGTIAGRSDSVPAADSVASIAAVGSVDIACACPGNLCQWYSFKGSFIDLGTNKQLAVVGLPAGDFKTCTKFRHRYTQAAQAETLDWQSATFRVTKTHELEIKSGKTTKRYAWLKKPAESPHDHPWGRLRAMPGGVVLLADDDDTCFTVAKYDANGNELFRTNVQHTHIGITGNTHHYQPYLGVEAWLEKQLVFTTQWFGEKNKTVVVDLATGKKTEYDFVVSGIVRDSTEQGLAGLLEIRNDSLCVFHRFSDGSQTSIPKNKWDESCETVLAGDYLLMATYHRIATGSALSCFNLATKKQQWKADVLQLMVSHSQYQNSVSLAVYKNKVILEGNEMGGDYLQLFDLQTGKRLAEFGVFPQK